MKTCVLLTLVVHAFNVANAASACKKDACFNDVTVQKNNNPKYAVRRADCSSVLKTIYADEKTVTVTSTSTSTVYPQTVQPRIKERTLAAPQITTGPEPIQSALLQEREQIVAGGKRPTYASGCKDIKQYATACICFGVKASTYLPGPTKTKTVMAIATVFPRGPPCSTPNALEGGGCSSNCFCDPRGPLFNGVGFCNNAITCTTPCASDNDCANGFACIIGGGFANFACGGSTCASYTACTTTFDPNNPAQGGKMAKIASPVNESEALAARLKAGANTVV